MQIYSVFLRRVFRQLRILLAFTILVATTIPSTPLRAQTLQDYEFSTGIDASRWITTSDWTTIFNSGVLLDASSVMDIGFSFPFGDSTYTQFSVSVSGVLRFGPEATANWYPAGTFNSTYYTLNLPRISGVARYGNGLGTGSNGYIRYALTGTAPYRVLVCEYRMAYFAYPSNNADVMWQVQLYETTGEISIVYGSTTPANCPQNFQTGLATSPTDIVLLSPDTHTPVYSTIYNNTTYGTWHGANRYYSFTLPSSTCPRPESIAVSNIGTSSLTATWVDNGGASQWEVHIDRRNMQGTPVVVNTPSYTFTGLTNGTDYTVRVRGICGPGDTTAVRSLPVQTLCGYLQLPYSESFEDALGTVNTDRNGLQNNLPNCWDYHNEGSNNYSIYPYVIIGSGHSGVNFMRSYVNTASAFSPEYAFLPFTNPIIHPVNSLELSYWIRRENSTHPSTCIVGITPDPTDISTFIPVDTMIRNNDGWIQRTVHFNNYTGPHGRITMLFPKQTGSPAHPNWTFIDDINLFSHNSFDTVTHTACNSYTWPENGITYTNSGNYNHTLPNAAGYDSIITLQLTIYHSYAGDTTAVVCDSITWRGNYYSESGNYIDTIFLSPLVGCDSTATLHLTVNHRSGLPVILPGATESHFSVSSTQTVQFSKGNLQYQASTGLWRFAEHQYDYIGDDNTHISSTYDGWIDLFGWGTSGWNSGATEYQPYSSFANSNRYQLGGDVSNDLTGSYAEADWGWHNAIQNGGNRNHQWRTLIHTEWEYLFNTRTTNTNLGTPNARYAKASINGTKGVILFPDEYTHPADVTVPLGINATDNTGWDGNTYSTTDWDKMDSAGAVFLPAARMRDGTALTNIGLLGGYYWAADRYIDNNSHAHMLKFNNTSLNPSHHNYRYLGISVRPVHNTDPVIPNDTVAEACNSFTWWNTNYTNSTNTPTHLYTTTTGCDSLVTLHLTINHSSTGDTTATACDSFTWWGTTYTSSTNSATHTFTNAAGCDSVVTLHLTINHSNTGDTTVTTCNSFSWWNSNYTNSTNSATHNFTNSAGCDSVVTLHLTINHSNTGDTFTTACNSFTWWNTNYTNSTNSATHTFTNAAGCDSVVTLHLTINHSNTGDTNATACNSFNWWNTNYTNSTNSATHTFTNAAGCDSVVTLHLTINNSNTGDTNATACNSFTWWNTNYTNSTNSATHSFTNAAGCDSVVTLHLTINNSNTGDTNATACNSFNWWNTNYTNSTNSATHSFTNAAGCDSVVTLHLTINNSNTGDTNATACNSFNWWGNSYTSSTNSATHTFTNAAGCDSVATLHLTINHPTTGDTTTIACNSFIWWGTNYTTTGDYVRTWTSTFPGGCDSTVTLHLTVNYSNTGIEDTTVCNSIVWHGTEYTASTNTPTFTCLNAAGCDSVTTLHLNVNQCSSTTVTACDSYTWRGHTYTATGIYTDGTDTLNLTVNHSNTGDTTVTACDSFTWWGNSYTSSTNSATHTFTNATGCDSVVTLLLTINHPTTRDTTAIACNSFTWWGTPYSTTGNYVRTWPSALPGECDSTVTMHLTVIYSNTGIEDTTVCNSIVWHGTEYTASTNTPTFTCLNAAGCDSVTTLHLTVNHCSTTPITVCDSYTWRGHTYTTSGIYVDGTDTLNLTVNHSNTGDTTVTACNNFTWWSTTYTNSTNSATHTYTNVAGCDSVVTLHLTINHSNTGDTNATACNSFTWWGTPYSSTGDYVRTWPSTIPGGCDSVVTLHLTINHPTTGDTTAIACNSFTWWGTPYSSTGDYVRTWLSTIPGGCDSVVTLNLTVNYSNTGIEDTTVCNSIVWHGTEYTASTNTPTFTCLNAAGCDSVTTLHLTVNQCSSTTVIACDSYTWRGHTYTATGVYTDGTDTLNLTVNYSNTGEIFVTACDSFTWWSTTYTNSTNSATHSFTNVAGCDSTVTLHLTINHSNTGDTTATACESFTWWNTNYTNSTNSATYTFTNVAGCDSTVTLHLTINHSNTDDTFATACNSFTWYGTIYTTTGDYVRTWSSTFPGGCDSVVTLHLTINHATTGDTTAIACDSFTWWGTNYNTTGNYVRTWPSTIPGGCDSTVTLHLTIYHSHNDDTTAVVCDSITWRGNHYSRSGNHIDTISLSPLVGCDSTITLHLTVNHSNGLPDILPGATESFFSVSSTQTVQFSKGNLQYQASTGLWRFAEHQYDYVGSDNTNISSTYDGWIDLFGWGTSGWNSGATAYQPYSSHTANNYYYPGGSENNDLTGDYAEADWGWHNAIQNGGNRNHLWRTLLHYEWAYLFNNRTTNTNLGTPNARYAKASINGTHGVIIFPDEYNHPADVTVPVGINATDSTGWDGNSYSTTDWDKMDSAGAVFLPAAGNRGSIFENPGVGLYWANPGVGLYWAADRHIDYNSFVHYLIFNRTELLDPYGYILRYLGISVRPVHNTDLVITNDTVAEACESYSWYGTTYTTSGDYVRTWPSAIPGGCDSVVTLHLTINQSTTGDTTAAACDSLTWWGTNHTTTGDFMRTWPSALPGGCDSVVTLHLTVNHSTTGDTTATACDSMTWWGTNYTTTGDFMRTWSSALPGGCDSTVTLHLTINHSNTSDTFATACDSLTWWGTNYTTTGDFMRTWSSAFTGGCDSTVTLHLTINTPVVTEVYDTACESYTWHGTTYSVSGDFQRTGISMSPENCDTTETLHLELIHATYNEIADSFCTGTQYLFGSQILTESGLYADTLIAANSCDSIVSLNLTKLPQPYINIVQSNDCQTQTHHIRVETDVDYLYWTCNEQSWNSSWGSVHSHNLTVSNTFPITLTLLVDYNEYPTCPNTAVTTLQPIVQPQAVMDVSPEFITHETPTLVALSQSTGAKRLQWYIDGDDAGDSQRITYTPESGYDSVVLTLIAFSDLCSDTAERVIPIKQQTLYVPNAFTPNESTNKTFSIFYDGIIEYQLYIYNRQGIQVFHSNTNGEEWDGRYNGTLCPQGSYVWLVKYRSEVDPQNWHYSKGTVTLLY